MQVVFFAKSNHPNGTIANAERYGISIDNGNIVGVSLVGALWDGGGDSWAANRGEASCVLPCTEENAIMLFDQVASEMEFDAIDYDFVRSLVRGRRPPR